MEISLDDTICAIATPQGEGGIGIIRVSGDRAVELVSRMVKARSSRSLQEFQSQKLYLSDVWGEYLQSSGGGAQSSSRLIDQALVVVMRKPKSYTGEDVVEIHSHGSPFVLHATCQELVRLGARLANPGEFTQRAFLNGRLDLVQAEAVLDTIQAATAGSLRAAQELLRGSLSREVDRLRERLIRVLAHVEAGIDFVEEDITFIGKEEVASACQETMEDLNQLIDTFEEGRIVRDGVRTVIIGRPNVGKSSLLNALLRTDRAIVSSLPGTTRDVIDEATNVKGIFLRLVDTAGLRQTVDIVESEGIRRTQEAMDDADLLLVVIDRSGPLTEEDRDLLTTHRERRLVVVLNKSDLPQRVELAPVQEVMRMGSSRLDKSSGPIQPQSKIVEISTKTGNGMPDLSEAIRVLCLGRNLEAGQSVVVTRVRHKNALCQARDSVSKALDAVQSQMPGECVALDVRGALDALGEITGVVSTEDVLDRVFRDFCIGK